MQSHDNIIFVGMKISEKLRDQLDSCKTSMRPYFANNDSQFLQIIQIDSNEYIGKLTENGTSIDELSNMFKNLKTMLNMICPKFHFADDAIKVFARTPIPKITYY